METKKEDAKDQSLSGQTAKNPEQKISDDIECRIQKKFDEVNHSNEKKLLAAKLLISERRVTFLLAILTILLVILTILGIIYPLYKTERNTDNVDNAIQKMESRFKDLSGEYLRKPEIVCDISGKNLLNNSLTVGCSGDKTSQTFMIKNIGDASAGQTYIYLYVKYKDERPFLSYSGGIDFSFECEIYTNDNPQYYTKFWVCPINEFHAGRELDFRFEHSLKIDSPLEVPAMLKIYYNGPKPIEVPFTMRFIPKENIKNN
jgi:cell division protein FtsL